MPTPKTIKPQTRWFLVGCDGKLTDSRSFSTRSFAAANAIADEGPQQFRLVPVSTKSKKRQKAKHVKRRSQQSSV